jgi:hypothetical protein
MIDADDWTLPTNCEACGVYLMGGATEHKPGCPIRQVIERWKAGLLETSQQQREEKEE